MIALLRALTEAAQSRLTLIAGARDDLFRERGAYTYRNGVNWRAVAAFVIAVLPVVPGFARAVATPGGSVADPNFFDRLYAYAWFVTFGLSFIAYLLLMRRTPGPTPPAPTA